MAGRLSQFDRDSVLLRQGCELRRDDGWCLINPSSRGTHNDIILHHNRPVTPAPDPGSQERDQTPGTDA